MKRQISFHEYRAIDLAMFAVISAVFELITVKVAHSTLFYDQAFTVSLAGAMVSILYMRWDAWGILFAAGFGFIDCLYSGAAAHQYLIYIIGNMLSAVCVPVLKKIGSEKVRTGQWYLAFPLAVILLMQLGRAIVAVILGTDIETAAGFFTTDSLSILFTLVIIWIARRLDGIYENQKHYLLRVHEEDN